MEKYQGKYTDIMLEGAEEIIAAGEDAVENLEGHLEEHLANCKKFGRTPNQDYVTSANEVITILQQRS